MKKVLGLAAAMVVAALGVAQAQGGPDIVMVRQAAYSLLSGDFAGIRAVSAAGGDVKTLENPAKAIQKYAAVIPTLFPAGTGPGPNTKAGAAIWSDPEGFKKAAATLGEAAGKLAELAKAGDSAGVAEQIKAVGGACGGCHRTYQAK